MRTKALIISAAILLLSSCGGGNSSTVQCSSSGEKTSETSLSRGVSSSLSETTAKESELTSSSEDGVIYGPVIII